MRLYCMDITQLRTTLRTSEDPAAQAAALLLDAIVANPERARALVDSADAQLALEQVLADEQAADLGPVPDADGTLTWSIRCSRRKDAANRGDVAPRCTWKRDSCGYACQECGRWEGEETGNGSWIRSRFAANRVE